MILLSAFDSFSEAVDGKEKIADVDSNNTAQSNVINFLTVFFIPNPP